MACPLPSLNPFADTSRGGVACLCNARRSATGHADSGAQRQAACALRAPGALLLRCPRACTRAYCDRCLRAAVRAGVTRCPGPLKKRRIRLMQGGETRIGELGCGTLSVRSSTRSREHALDDGPKSEGIGARPQPGSAVPSLALSVMEPASSVRSSSHMGVNVPPSHASGRWVRIQTEFLLWSENTKSTSAAAFFAGDRPCARWMPASVSARPSRPAPRAAAIRRGGARSRRRRACG
jgi:hypothetical protein